MLDKAIGVVGLALALLFGVAPYRWLKMPRVATDIGLGLGAALMGLAAGLFLGASHMSLTSTEEAQQATITRLESEVSYLKAQAGFLSARLKPRTLSYKDAEAFMDAVKAPPNSGFVLNIWRDVGCGDCTSFAANFENMVLGRSGWTVRESPFYLLDLLFAGKLAGVVVAYNPTTPIPPCGEVIEKAMKAAGLLYSIGRSDEIPQGQCGLYVAERSPP